MKKFPALTLSLLCAVALAACGGGAAPAASTVAAPTANTAASKAPVASAAPSSAAGSAQSAPVSAPASIAAANGPIKIGIILPLTGSQANIGKDNEDGLKLYLKSINSTVAGRKVDPIFADDQFQADVSLTKAKELVENQKVAALMGFAATPSGYAVAQWVQQSAHVPMLITSNSGGEGMLTNPTFKSPYLTRWTQTSTEVVDVASDWAAKQGFRKAGMVNDDFAPGIQNADVFASTFIRRGGAIVQEIYTKLGTTDFGPYLAQINKSADVMFTFEPGIDGLRFEEQYGTYAGQHKLPIIDSFGTITAGPNLAQLKDKAIGTEAVDVFSQVSLDPGTQAFVKAWQAAYPNRLLSHDAAAGYMSGQVLVAALNKVNGQVENTQQFLQALYNEKVDSAKGPVHLDQDHDIVQNIYVSHIVKQGSGVGYQLDKTYTNVSDTFARSAQEIANFKWNNYKGKWVGMTEATLTQALK